jgi:RsiW-degrading membrane proteinase PrsW (M82 family)
MSALRFSLRQLLVGVALVAIVLLLVRYALRSHGLAAAVLTFAIGAVVLLLACVLLYGFLRVVGRLYSFDDDAAAPGEDASRQ